MKITILTLFPEIFRDILNYSILKRAQQKRLVEFALVNIRDFAQDKHKSVDDHPYGGGVGMIMRVDIIAKAILSVKSSFHGKEKIVLLDPRGKLFNQSRARIFSKLDHLVLICGHYEGVDERVLSLVDEVISLGDFVLTGGEIPSLAIIEATARLIPGVLTKKEATIDESFTKSLLSYPQYTRPRDYKNLKVPSILLSGNHKKILSWRQSQARYITKSLRPDLLKEKKG